MATVKEYPSVAIAAVKDVLDRTMGKAREAIEHSGGVDIVVRWQGDEDTSEK